MNQSMPVAIPRTGDDVLAEHLGPKVSPALQIFLNENLFERCVQVAKYLAGAHGFVPKHLQDKPQACFAVVVRAIVWKQDPYAVAQSTYETPGGKVGYEGKLIQSVLEASGHIEGGVKFEHYGDWSKLRGRFKIVKRTNQWNKEVNVPEQDWRPEEEEGIGVRVIAQLKNETEPRTLEFDLNTAYPRNSTLWAVRPQQQICYTAVRAFANMVVPHLLLGVPMDGDDVFFGDMKNVTPPKPSRDTAPVTDVETDEQSEARKKAEAEAQAKREEEERAKAEADEAERQRGFRGAIDGNTHSDEQPADPKPETDPPAKKAAAKSAKPAPAEQPSEAEQPQEAADVRYDPAAELQLLRKSLLSCSNAAELKAFIEASEDRLAYLKQDDMGRWLRINGEIEAKRNHYAGKK